MSQQLSIRMLGGFSVAIGDRVVPDEAWRLRRAKRLVKILALSPGHSAHREVLAELLWPGSAGDVASHNLRQVVHVARQALATVADGVEQCLTQCDGALALSAKVEVDVASSKRWRLRRASTRVRRHAGQP